MMVTQANKTKDINLHWAQECYTQRTQIVNILAGNIGNKVIGLFVIDGTQNGVVMQPMITAIASEFPLEDEESVINKGSNKIVRHHTTMLK